ncbi:hypothetical protein [Clostridium weizhouense]|uniref:Uncharacterized protein n=1 Tax=Clostridium weizhouense TaxID=2859781 RepID=A0ABS7APH7_9CLOT|nr:hypothetical protein [Clostridium weizhouense]MBW6410555.1 hypothetical protein [Clostridium weizhouense]
MENSTEWNNHKYVRKHDKEVLNEALKGYVGTTFTPIAVKSQVSNGTNYIFICGAVTIKPKNKIDFVEVHVNVPKTGEAQLTRIEKIK